MYQVKSTRVRMPTYEYRCKSCGHEFEEFQTMSSDPLINVPEMRQTHIETINVGRCWTDI